MVVLELGYDPLRLILSIFRDPSIHPHILTNTGGRRLIPASRLLRRPPPDPLLAGLFLFLALDPGGDIGVHNSCMRKTGMHVSSYYGDDRDAVHMHQPVRHTHHRT
jgi:hypothetical protein